MNRILFWIFGLALAWLLLRDEPAFVSLLDHIAHAWDMTIVYAEEKGWI
jgi:hypothetical protein